jgi:amino acid permease
LTPYQALERDNRRASHKARGNRSAKEQKMKMIIIGGVLTAALLFAVVSSIKADGPHWVAGGLIADGPAFGSAGRANGA